MQAYLDHFFEAPNPNRCIWRTFLRRRIFSLFQFFLMSRLKKSATTKKSPEAKLISTETKLGMRKTKIMVDHADTPHPTKIKKCSVFNENWYVDQTRCEENFSKCSVCAKNCSFDYIYRQSCSHLPITLSNV